MEGARLDHLVVTVGDLARGVERVEKVLGVAMSSGGVHPRMGTHNALLRLGESSYLEVIAPDPQAEPPECPRWFELDLIDPDAEPRLATWVVRVPDIRGYSNRPTSIEQMERGRFKWLIEIDPDGKLPDQGIGPTLIQWLGPAPAGDLPQKGCGLEKLCLFSPRAAHIQRRLDEISFEGPVRLAPTASQSLLVALIKTPTGLVELR